MSWKKKIPVSTVIAIAAMPICHMLARQIRIQSGSPSSPARASGWPASGPATATGGVGAAAAAGGGAVTRK